MNPLMVKYRQIFDTDYTPEQAERERLLRQIGAQEGTPSPAQRAAMQRLDLTGEDVRMYRARKLIRPASEHDDGGEGDGPESRERRRDDPPPPAPTRHFAGPNWLDGFTL